MLRVTRASVVRFCSSSVGKKFESRKHIEEYLSRATWRIEDYIPNPETTEPVAEDEVKKLLKLSGLPEGDNAETQRRLANQLKFINKLHDVDVNPSSISEDARLMSRTQDELTFEQLTMLVKAQSKNDDLAERSGFWDCTSLATLKDNGYFVVRGNSMKNRK
ncbi:glutamyl-tRNA(Gln) amidotransferase subunit F Ecym_4421 [Eremothecium cymbalariae DBVPG|uniref:Glutamyl-tRNA(Gln) amidotransferase subunit F, mitochondrial n=1 Tax=Eremothecium cymbalariae (strain CBS 270.75 / DBVPG 7215 / KCTC 17166 / NRRL Y-17582) TaxID=931890 RepID=G8JTW7_ERECY|nr:hypothetical protein Ecym_4421 [Eremothecium cymbalariae DBVPG\